jgi:hypothetical protein
MKKFLCLTLSIITGAIVTGQTTVPPGPVSGTWTLEGSPYLVMGETTILNGTTLVIESGVRVEFQGSYTMFVQGRIIAQGTETDSIVFTAADTAAGFNSIRFLSTPIENDTSIFEYCEFTYGRAQGPYPDNFGGVFGFIDFGKIIIDHCRFAYNRALWQTVIKPGGGSAIATLRCSPVIRNSIFEYNRGFIGAVLVLTTDSTLVENNLFQYNAAPHISDYREGIGGVIFCKWGSHAVIRGNIFYRNHADLYGGAIFCWNYGNARIENNLIYENDAGDYGGALGMDSCSSPILINNTIVNNSAVNRSGGINVNFNSDPVIYNTILWGNTAPAGSQLYINTNDCSPNFYFSDIQGGQNAFGGAQFAGEYISCIDSIPLFLATGNELYSLSENSPCIDTGTPDTTGLNLPLWDLMGNSRVWDGDSDGDTIVDMGAYEFGSVGVSTEEFKIQNSKFKIEIFPNPAEDEVVVSVNSRQSSVVSYVTLSICDLYGREVRTLKDVVYSPGEYNVRMDVSGLPPGVYLVRLQAGGQSAVRKLVVR